MFGTQDIILIGIIVVVLFGATRLPQIGSVIGQVIMNLKKSINEPEKIESPKKDSANKEHLQSVTGLSATRLAPALNVALRKLYA